MNPPPSKPRKTADVVRVVLFAAVLTFPGVSWLCGWTPAPALQENRCLAPFPAFRLSRGVILGFPAAFDAYVNDHCPFRDQFVWFYNRAKARGLGISPRPEVVIGERGWLFFRDGLLDQNSAVPAFTEAELDQWTRVLEARRRWLAARGCRFLVVVAPDKHTVYPEHLPGWAPPLPRPSRLDQLLAYAQAHSAVTILDLREPLLQAKARERVYWMTDTHWNDRGSFVGYQCIADALAQWFPRVQPLPRSAFAPGALDTEGGDLARMLGLPRDYREEQLSLTPLAPRLARPAEFTPSAPPPPGAPDLFKPFARECENKRLPKAVMFRDSFTTALAPLLSEHFARIVYLWQDAFDTAVVERERPDVVLYEFVERRLIGPCPENDLPAPPLDDGARP